MKCYCGFEFSGPGEFRNCEAFVTKQGSGVVCPECERAYINGLSVIGYDDEKQEYILEKVK